MKIRIALMTALAMLGLGLLTSTPAHAGSETPEVSIHKADGVNGVQVAQAINNLREGSRDAFTQKAVQEAFDKAGGQYNVVMMNLSAGHEERLNNVKLYANVKYGAVYYGLWIFEDGEFTNTGDGGFLNWAFQGWFDRDGSTVRFHRP